ncbi:hypothetical protein K1W69_06595 [Hoeflea sp. WL0058]|uniref:G5 domain-containing protein n=1 Tax=Flavimaribacter sediminis TaxID=2865987 RepID=A0AAE2ZLU8_9HYPH|nr:hypothetical protein [Flavimaribacter sediminis]MBW8636850.1 hypothetical protein [Flavimaribacter sediminis]
MAHGSKYLLTTALLLAGSAVLHGCSSHNSATTAQSAPPVRTTPSQVASAETPATQDEGSKATLAAGAEPEVETETQSTTTTVAGSDTVEESVNPSKMAATEMAAEKSPEEPASEEIVEAVRVTETPGKTDSTVEIVETPEAIVERVEETITTEEDIDTVIADTGTGVVAETEEIRERTDTVVKTTVVDKRTGRVTKQISAQEKEEVQSRRETIIAPAPSARVYMKPEAGPDDRFAAYGLVAFPLDTARRNPERLAQFCAAYVESGKHEPVQGLPASAPRMATVWPVSASVDTDALSRLNDVEKCETAVLNYGAATADQAIYEAELTGIEIDGRGPFLLAWSPASAKGSANALVLIANLSNIDAPEAALAAMRRWQTDVEFNPPLWAEAGWNLPLVREIMDEWSAVYGPQSLMLLGPFGG